MLDKEMGSDSMRADSPPHASLGHDEADQAGACLFKPHCLSCDEMTAVLSAKGLDFNGRHGDDVAVLLKRYGYYHLRGFWTAFEDGADTSRFIRGTTIDDIINIVSLNDGLSSYILDLVRPIEIALRSTLSQAIVGAAGAFALDNATLFKDSITFDRMHSTLRRELLQGTRNAVPFVKANLAKYDRLPVWATLELTSLGTMSKLYGNLADPSVAREVAATFGTKPRYLENWLRCLTLMRNMCAHHDRIYNRMFPIQPALYKEHAHVDRMRLFPQLIVLLRMHDAIAPEQSASVRLRCRRIMEAHPSADLGAIGFPQDWQPLLGIPTCTSSPSTEPRARGHQGGRPPKDDLAVEEALFLYDLKQDTITEICHKTGVCSTTLYKYIHLREEDTSSAT